MTAFDPTLAARIASEGVPLSADLVQDTDRIVAYRSLGVASVLLCCEHGPRYAEVVPVTAEELPDGGICTFGRLSSLECGRDVLADEHGLGGAR